MNVTTAIETRRAIKAFDPGHRMSEAEIKKLMSLAMLAPTAFNIQNWRFVVVQDPELRKQIRAASWDQVQVTDASLFIVLTADLKSWEKQPERYWKNTPKPVQDYLIPAIGQYYGGNEPEVNKRIQRDEGMRSCGMAAMTLMLAANEMGYDSCPMDGFDFDAVAKLINLPADHTPAMYVAIGKGIKDPWPRGGQLAFEEIIIQNKFK